MKLELELELELELGVGIRSGVALCYCMERGLELNSEVDAGEGAENGCEGARRLRYRRGSKWGWRAPLVVA